MADEGDFDPDVDGIPSARDAMLAWNDHLLVVRAVNPGRQVRDEGYQPGVAAEDYDSEIPLRAIIALRAKRPWPAIELEWQASTGNTTHRLLVHPRGVDHPVPRAREVLASYERFDEHVVQLFNHVPARARAGAGVELVRGWLDDLVVPFEAAPALPAGRGRGAPYRGDGEAESLLVHTALPAALMPRLRHHVARLVSRASTHDGLSALALSERYVWAVKESGHILRIARDDMRGLFTDGERLDLVFGRSSFLSVTLPSDAPIRAAMLEAADEAAARLRARQRVV